MAQLIDRALRKLREYRFLRGCRAVLATPPARTRDDGVVIFSMIGTKVLLPYLVAAKSFQSRLGRGRVWVAATALPSMRRPGETLWVYRAWAYVATCDCPACP